VGTHPLFSEGSGDPEGLFVFVADVLLHQMIHQWQQEVAGKQEHGDHGPSFRDKVNEIGKALGLPPVRTKRYAKGEE
jgi:hypothetical protein